MSKMHTTRRLNSFSKSTHKRIFSKQSNPGNDFHDSSRRNNVLIVRSAIEARNDRQADNAEKKLILTSQRMSQKSRTHSA